MPHSLLYSMGMLALMSMLSTTLVPASSQWAIPKEAPLLTEWSTKVNPLKPLPDYPRPHMVRARWLNLNGLWEYALPSDLSTPPFGKKLDGRILVPYPIESALSGVMKRTERIWYRRTFTLPSAWKGSRTLLHFGAVDWDATVYVNGKQVGTHRGGYDPFSFDITGALNAKGPQEIIVGVFDPSDGGDQPRGKQVRQPKGIWYTPCTGIWQTVWCEPVPASHITQVHIVPSSDAKTFAVAVHSNTGDLTERCVIAILDGKKKVAHAEGQVGKQIDIPIPTPKLWAPESPFLYDVKVVLQKKGRLVDEVSSYAGMRTVSIARDERGIQRLMLNGKPCFQVGPLDQGFWPDGIYTAPTDAALRYDIEMTKKLGFNMTRKHVKVEPSRWYYWADRLGLLVWQDMPSGNNKTPESRVQFETELQRLVETHQHHPSIIMWVVFNEGWGQYDTEHLAEKVKHLDPSRLVNNASGWTDKNAGDVMDIHNYPAPRSPEPESDRAIVLGEFGGLGLAVPGHTWQKEHWGYKGMADANQLLAQYEEFLNTVYSMRETSGLSAAIYTQITDVEVECNGLLTYDRKVVKASADRIAAANNGTAFHKQKNEPVSVLPAILPQDRSTREGANRAPLVQSPLIKLPIGSIRPQGWLQRMLELEREGMTGRLSEISPWLDKTKSAWADREGKGARGWEELPYWLKGYGDLGYVLGDTAIQREARFWIEAMLGSQREDGWFGPRELLTSLNGKPDLWPHMVALNILQSFYEYTHDPRVVPFMIRYFTWQRGLPPESFGAGYWPKLRMGDNIESALWLYNRTGESWLLALADTMHAHMARWDRDVINWHNVNIAQGFRAPAMLYPAAKDFALYHAAERNYRKVMGEYGQFPGGGFAADENARPGFIDPRQGFETCGIVEFMHSFQLLTRTGGETIWSDRCEELAFNSLPAAMTPDQKALHYLTCANQVQLDKGLKTPGIQNGGTMFSYSPFQTYRCCQHNVAFGWPYFAEELWLATWDGGLCASLYAPSTVKTTVANGTDVTISEETGYPFDGMVRIGVASDKPVKFPLYLRIPGWCEGASVTIGGKTTAITSRAGSFIRLDRVWSPGDVVSVTFEMPLRTKRWEKNNNALSIARGPLNFSLKIDERWERYGTNADWPEWEVFPASPWNYGLVVDSLHPVNSFTLEQRKPDPSALPWTAASMPVVVKAKGRKIEGWQQDYRGLIGPLQKSPARTSLPEEPIELIPMGAARLRISAFPTVTTGPGGVEWVPPRRPNPIPFTISYSYINRYEDPEAVADGFIPKSSDDESVTRMSWWDHKGTDEWIQYDFPAEREISGASVYWYDDGEEGSTRVPESWRLLYKKKDRWIPVNPKTGYGTNVNMFNTVTFEKVEATGVRLEVKLQKGFTAGVLEWEVN